LIADRRHDAVHVEIECRSSPTPSFVQEAVPVRCSHPVPPRHGYSATLQPSRVDRAYRRARRTSAQAFGATRGPGFGANACTPAARKADALLPTRAGRADGLRGLPETGPCRPSGTPGSGPEADAGEATVATSPMRHTGARAGSIVKALAASRYAATGLTTTSSG
jgi:hypothetical protein